MTELMPVFIDNQVLRFAPGATVADAVSALGADAAEQFAAGSAHVTDGRGIRLASDAPIHAGAILRLVGSARREKDEADAHS